MRWSSLVMFWRTYRAGGPNGDLAIFKADAAGARATPAVERKLADVRGYAPAVDLDVLRRLPDGTLGREYVRLLDDNGYGAFVISDAVPRAMLERNVFGHRIAVTHDMFHVLTGFDTTWAGELGVLAFTSAQGYARVQRYVALPLALLLYPVLAPRQIPALVRCLVQGWRMGRRAHLVLGYRLEDWFARPVDEARRQLALPLPARPPDARWGYLPRPTALA